MNCGLLLLTMVILNASELLAQAQEGRNPFQVSPLIGDTLDPVEREYFHLFPTIEGFQWAVFYPNPNNTIGARVAFLDGDILRDSLIKYYGSSSSLREHLRRMDESQRRDRDDRGAEIAVALSDSQTIRGRLLAVRDSEIVVAPDIRQHIKGGTLLKEGIIAVKNNNIQKVYVEGHSRILLGAGIGFAAGLVMGAVAASGNEPKPTGSRAGDALYDAFEPLSKTFYALEGALVGAGVGALLGGAASSSDKDIPLLTHRDRLALKLLARYPLNEPEELRDLK